MSNLNLWTSSLMRSKLHQHINPARYPEHMYTHKNTQTRCKTTRPRSCSETSVRVEAKVCARPERRWAAFARVESHTLSTHSNHPHVYVFGAVGELRFCAVPGGPDSCLDPHIKHTSIQHARQGSPKTNTRACCYCRNGARIDWPRMKNIK